ncbi:ABC-three component system protein [Myroides sp. LJL116]
MIQLIDPNDIHSAAATWSGFVYQGKVALYHVLNLIYERNDVDGFHLQLESIEDFAIVEYDNFGNIVPISLHQVKAMKSNLYSDYRDDFIKIEKRKRAFSCTDNAYFHLATQNERSKIDIETVHPDLKIYQYNNQDFCRVEELQALIIDKIKHCLDKYNKIEFIQNESYVMILSGILEDIITSQILAVHASNHKRNGLTIREGAYYFTVPLENFVSNILLDYNDALFGEKFYYKRVLLDLNNYYQQFCIAFDDLIDVDGQSKLANYLLYLNNLSDNEFKEFLQKISPQKEIKYTNLEEYKNNTLDNENFKAAFLYTLLEIRDSDGIGGSKLGWKDIEGKFYFPSTINSSNSRPNRRLLCQGIMDTVQNTLIDIPFNSDFIITDNCDIESIEHEAGKIFVIGEDIDHNKKITNWKKVSLIDREQAKQKLNDNIN